MTRASVCTGGVSLEAIGQNAAVCDSPNRGGSGRCMASMLTSGRLMLGASEVRTVKLVAAKTNTKVDRGCVTSV